ncbi:uncharacterized protein LOC114181486 [Vigna unguiculata]|uniref:Uncharacterized protein n=1 Tax=Vigna unguiculata TaxID=3917 RepID=A0A4D6M5H1_VIGUN|nr:uncharacterized protein LOC114181486 [Vigna unguiculata]QCD95224.1 hypothetical protein DEO72_LG5g3317 [Vigna unguiculata]
MQKEEEHESVEEWLVCPSFSAYSSNRLDDIADQVTRNDDRFDQNDTDFEFVAFRKVADGVFLEAVAEAEIQTFPIFHRDLAAADADSGSRGRDSGEAAIQSTLGKLLLEESTSCSSSEVDDELENVPPETYCVWTPKPSPVSTPCRKSKSTGSSSSKRWKLLDLLRRSNSEGKESAVFLTPSVNSAKKKGVKPENGKKIVASGRDGKMFPTIAAIGGGGKRFPAIAAVSAHEALYVRNREMRREDKRRSYLPYRQDLVGFCVNLNTMGKAFPLLS